MLENMGMTKQQQMIPQCKSAELEHGADPHPGGNADVHQNKRVAGKAIRKAMKTKG